MGRAVDLQARRAALRLTQRTVAAAAQVSLSYLGQLERGKCDPTLGVARRIAEVLGVSVDTLWPPESDPEPSTAAEGAR